MRKETSLMSQEKLREESDSQEAWSMENMFTVNHLGSSGVYRHAERYLTLRQGTQNSSLYHPYGTRSFCKWWTCPSILAEASLFVSWEQLFWGGESICHGNWYPWKWMMNMNPRERDLRGPSTAFQPLECFTLLTYTPCFQDVTFGIYSLSLYRLFIKLLRSVSLPNLSAPHLLVCGGMVQVSPLLSSSA